MKKQSLKDDMPISDEVNKSHEPIMENVPDDMQKTTLTGNYPWLTLIMHHLQSYCDTWLTATDLNMLTFSLEHLFIQIDALYTCVLPTLEIDENIQVIRTVSAEFSPTPQARQYYLWSQLRLILRTLERIEILCHLLNVTVMGIIQMLDQQITDANQLLSNPINNDDNLWEEAALALEEHMLAWQQNFTITPSLATSCADVVLATHTLEELDKAFQHILERALALFGDILPDLRIIEQGDAETIASCLLDLLQQNDDMLIRIDRVIELLDALIKQYSQAMTTR